MSVGVAITDARALTDQIRTTVGFVWELIVEAYTSRAWETLGYESWDDYTRWEFDGARIALPREDRQEVVASLRDSGLSLRAIASATGVSKGTVQNDLATGQNCPVEPVTVTTTTTQHVDAVTGEILDPPPGLPPPPSSGPQAPGGAPIVGVNGKTYQRQSVEAQFTSDERELLERLKDGRTVVLNMRADSHARLWAWADAHDLAVRIDRKSDWGNPFVLDEDGDREQVIGKYAAFYFPHKPQLIAEVGKLKGKALGCWCAPERCHGDVLAAAAS